MPTLTADWPWAVSCSRGYCAAMWRSRQGQSTWRRPTSSSAMVRARKTLTSSYVRPATITSQYKANWDNYFVIISALKNTVWVTVELDATCDHLSVNLYNMNCIVFIYRAYICIACISNPITLHILRHYYIVYWSERYNIWSDRVYHKTMLYNINYISILLSSFLMV